MKKLSNNELQNVSGGLLGALIVIGVAGVAAYQGAKHAVEKYNNK